MNALILSSKCSSDCLTERHLDHASNSTQLMMARRKTCPYCSDVLLRHIRSRELYWRCGTCHESISIAT